MAYKTTIVRVPRTVEAGWTIPAPKPVEAPEPPDPTPPIPGPRPEEYLELTILQPEGLTEPVPGVVWMHGGGYCMGGIGMIFESRMMPLVEAGEAVVVSPDYRLAGQAPYPAAFEDSYHALLYLRDHAEELGVRSDQLFVGGESAGGGLAAAVCMKARDTGDVNVAFQMPVYAMLDCFDTESSRDNHGNIWNTPMNHWAWPRYLGELANLAPEDIPPYASPARQTNYAGLPPAYAFVSDGEPFYAENVAYKENLQAAGIEAELDVFSGNTHAFDLAFAGSEVANAAAASFEAHFRYAASHYFAPQK